MNIKKHLQNLIKKLNPDRPAEDRIKEKVFARLNLETPKRKLNLFDLFTMNKKVIFGTLSLAAVGIFVGLPIMMGATTNKQFATTGLADLEMRQEESILTIDESNERYSAPTPTSGGEIAHQDTTTGLSGFFEGEMATKEDAETKETERAKEKWAELFLRVDNVSDSISLIYELTGTVEGYVISSDYSTGAGNGRGSITIRVPSDKFDYTVKELREYSVEIISESTNIVDIQNEITANENTLTELRKQLDEAYAKLDAATSTGEKASLERTINQLENQIKIYEEEASQLEQRASYSTIEIELTQEAEEIGNDLDDVFTKALDVAKGILEFWARIAIWGVLIIPSVALPVLAFFAAKRLRKWVKERKK